MFIQRHQRILSVLLLVAFGFSVISTSIPNAAALSAITFTTKETLSSNNLQFQQVSESSTGPDYATFLDATATGTYQRSHYSNYALQLNGATQYATIPYVSLSSLTYSIWFKVPTAPAGDTNLFSYMKTLVRIGGGQIKWYSDVDLASYNISATITAGTWHDIIVSQSGTTFTLYLDGSALVTNASTNPIDTTNFSNQIGAFASTNNCVCLIDNVGVWSVAKDATQAASIYAGNFDSTGNELFYRMNEGTGATIYDKQTGAGRSGSLTGSPVFSPNVPSGGESNITTATTTLSGSGNTINSGAYTSPVDLSRYSASLDGVNDDITAANVAVPNPSITVSVWLYLRSVGPEELVSEWQCAPNPNEKGFDLYVAGGGSNALSFVVADGAVVYYAPQTYIINSGNINQWHHVVGQATTNTISLWVDNQLIGTGTGTFTPQPSTVPLYIGRHSGCGAIGYANTAIDDLNIYSDYKSPSDITTLYNGGVITANRVLAYDFNNGVGTSTKDLAGSNTGTLENGVIWTSAVPTQSVSRPTTYITGRDTVTGKNGYAKISLADLSKTGDLYQVSSYYPRAIAQSTTNIWGVNYDSASNGNLVISAIPRSLASYSEASLYTGTGGNPGHGVLANVVGGNLINIGAGAPQTIAAEKITATSTLLGRKIDGLSVDLAKAAGTTGTATIGIFDASGNPVTTFGTQDVSLLTTSFVSYRFVGQNRVIQAGDYIGVKFTGGDATHYIQSHTTASDTFDGTNSIISDFNGSWTDNASFDYGATFIDTSNIKMAVYDGTTDVSYTFFECGSTTLCVVKYAGSASTISTSMAHTAGKPYQIIQSANQVLIMTDSKTYSLSLLTDTVSQVYSNTFPTRYPQTFSITPAARTYITSVYIANSTIAYSHNPTTDTRSQTGLFVTSTVDSTGAFSVFAPTKYYYLPTNLLTLEASTDTGTTWTLKSVGSNVQLAPVAYSEQLGVNLISNSTLFSKDVFRLVCATGSYHVPYGNYFVGSDSDCTMWRVLPTSSATVGRQIYEPYSRTASLVHVNPQTNYEFVLAAENPTYYSLKSSYNNKIVDVADFDAAGHLQQRYLYGQCYPVTVINNHNGNTINLGNICANDSFTKNINLASITIPVNWTAPGWTYTLTRVMNVGGSGNSQVTFSIDSNPHPYNASIVQTDHYLTTYQTYHTWYNTTLTNPSGTNGVFTINPTIADNATAYFIVYDQNMVPRITASSFGKTVSLTPLKNAWAPVGNIFGVSPFVFFIVLGAGVFVKSNAQIGIIVVAALAGFFAATELISLSDTLIGVITAVGALGAIYAGKKYFA